MLKLLAAPIIGALIGYCTNYIAVKMLFRPLHPVYLFGKQLPFTPGIIPKGQQRLARAIGGVVGTTLLTDNDFQESLLSEKTIAQLRENITGMLTRQQDTTLQDICLTVVSPEAYDTGRDSIQGKLTDIIVERLQAMQLGDTIAQQVLAAVKQKASGSFIGMMLNDDFLAGFSQPIADGIERYLQTYAYGLIYPQLLEVWGDLEQKTVQDMDTLLQETLTVSLTDIIVRLYETLIREKASEFVRMLDIGQIAEKKVNAMRPEELEELVLSVMKKELNAVVSLGALVGFVLGLLNLLF